MHHPAADDPNAEPGPDPDGSEGDRSEANLRAMETDMDAVDTVLGAIDRGDLDEAEQMVDELSRETAAQSGAGAGAPEPDGDGGTGDPGADSDPAPPAPDAT